MPENVSSSNESPETTDNSGTPEPEAARVLPDGAVPCHFWDPATATGKNIAWSNSKCQGAATGFVRVTHSNRLCPLCDACKGTFTRAQKEMADDVKKSIPGSGEYAEVSLADGKDEFSKQPAKQVSP